jgi:hypothetical protein
LKILLDVNLSRRVAMELRNLGVGVDLVVDEMDPRSTAGMTLSSLG